MGPLARQHSPLPLIAAVAAEARGRLRASRRRENIWRVPPLQQLVPRRVAVSLLPRLLGFVSVFVAGVTRRCATGHLGDGPLDRASQAGGLPWSGGGGVGWTLRIGQRGQRARAREGAPRPSRWECVRASTTGEGVKMEFLLLLCVRSRPASLRGTANGTLILGCFSLSLFVFLLLLSSSSFCAWRVKRHETRGVRAWDYSRGQSGMWAVCLYHTHLGIPLGLMTQGRSDCRRRSETLSPSFLSILFY